LSVRNYRLYFCGQLVSMSGTWMQTVAQALLVLHLTGQGTALGVVTALQFLPVLVLGPVGGLFADRFNKRRIIFVTQTISALFALTLGVLVATDTVRLWMVYVLAAGLGAANSLDSPARQTFVFELVGADRLTNAIGLNSGIVNLARVIGPAAAGVFIATVGLAPCFLCNAVSFIPVLVALALMRPREFHHTPPTPRRKGQIREGLRYVRSTPELLAPLLLLAVVGIFAWEFQVTLPLLSTFTFHAGAGAYGAMAALMGIGAIAATVVVASRRRPGGRALAAIALALGVVMLAVAAAPSLTTALVLMVPLGGFAFALIALGNVLLQLTTRPQMRGRVMALWFVAVAGTTPIGAPIIGWIADDLGPRLGLAVGGIASIVAALLAYPVLVHHRSREVSATANSISADEIELASGIRP
jgi:MFS family permease